MRTFTVLAISAMSLAASAPALAQGMMAKDGATRGDTPHMSAADTRMMNGCKAMPHERMMRNRGCSRLMQRHPDMMKPDAMTKHDTMMKHDGMMKHN